jgi:NTE family protein
VNLFKKILLALFVLSISNLTAQETQIITLKTRTVSLPYGLEEKIPAAEPIVGLALSGGGARGLAQIGVIKALEEVGIKINDIAGTSIGSIIGGAYAAGYTVHEMDSIVINTDWDMLLSLNNASDRRELFVDQKISEDRSLLTLRLNGFSPVIPTSFNEGLRLSNYLTMLCLSAPIVPQKSFDDLLVKYRAVCTNLVNGDEVILKSGSLARAMRASSSVTFLLSPVNVDSLTLVDGGLVSNIPVKVATAMGSDYVIAVNTTSKLHNEEELELPWNIADQTVSIPMKKLEQHELSKANFLLEPNIEKWSSTDFVKVDSLILAGYNYTKHFIPEIKKQLDSILIKKSDIEKYWLKNVMFPNDVDEDIFNLTRKYHEEDSVSSTEIYNDMTNLYKTGKYDSLAIVITRNEDSTQMDYRFKLKPLIKEVELLIDVPADSIPNNDLIHSLIGKPFDGRIIFNAARSLIFHYKKSGYISFTLQQHQFDDETGKLTLEFRGGKITAININSETSKAVINREFNIKVGDRLLYSNLEEGLQNLRATGLFDDIFLEVVKTWVPRR